jgi:hypothetical protein
LCLSFKAKSKYVVLFLNGVILRNMFVFLKLGTLAGLVWVGLVWFGLVH